MTERSASAMNWYPDSVWQERSKVAAHGDFRERVRYDLTVRPPYAFGVLAAADLARFFGVGRITAIEFGVASGAGLRDLCALASDVTQLTGIGVEIVGFDTGRGLPALKDYRDHPEIWMEGDFSTVDKDDVERRLPSNARVIWGEVADTLDSFVQQLRPEAPIGFVAHDMDIYHSTWSALAVYRAEPGKLLPVSLAYFDDTLGKPTRIGSLLRNRWAGQLGAIEDFNAAHEHRKIDVIRTLRYRRPLHREPWLEQVYAVHVLDHPARSVPAARRSPLNAFRSRSGFEWPL